MKVIQTVQTKVKTRKFPNCKTNQVLTTEKDDFYVQYCFVMLANLAEQGYLMAYYEKTFRIYMTI